jgi:hypothetical protein
MKYAATGVYFSVKKKSRAGVILNESMCSELNNHKRAARNSG